MALACSVRAMTFVGIATCRCDGLEGWKTFTQPIASSGVGTHVDYRGVSNDTGTIKGHRDEDGHARIILEETGARRSGELLAVPHVKMVLFLVCVVQVRTHPHRGCCAIFDLIFCNWLNSSSAQLPL